MRDNYVSCKDCVDLLHDFLDSSLDPDMLKKLDEHLSACPPCVNFLNTYRSCAEMGHLMRDQAVQIPATLEKKLKEFLRKELNLS
jgi:anti-sigma factor RsiW